MNIHRGQPIQSIVYFMVVAVTVSLLATPYYKFSPLPAIALAGWFIAIRWPQFIFYLILFMIPFGAYRTLGDGVKLHWILAFVLMLIILLQSLVQKQFPDNLNARLWRWLGLFFLIAVISMLFSPYRETAVHNLILIAVAFLFFAISLVMLTEDNFELVLPRVIVWSVSIGSFLAILGFTFNIHLFAEHVDAGSFKRGIGGSLDPNNLSLMAVFALPLLAHWMFHAENARTRLVALLLTIVNLGAVVSTFSRGGFLVLLATIGLIIWNDRHMIKTRNIGLLVASMMAIVLAVILLVPGSYWERQKSLVDGKDFALERRTSYLMVGWSALKTHPLIGNGPGAFREIYGRSDLGAAFEKKGKTRKRYAHNTYLEILVGMGLPGLIIFLIIIYIAFKNFSESRRRCCETGQIKLASVIGSYRISFMALSAYLMIFSDAYHKYLLLSLATSEAALYVTRKKVS